MPNDILETVDRQAVRSLEPRGPLVLDLAGSFIDLRVESENGFETRIFFKPPPPRPKLLGINVYATGFRAARL